MTPPPAPTGRDLAERYQRARTDPELAVLEGFHAVKHALRFDADLLHLATPDRERPLGLARSLAPDLVEELGRRLEEVPEELYRELTPRPPDSGVVALATRPRIPTAEILSDPSPRPVVLLEAPTHLGNLGAAIRVAAAADAAGLVSTGEHDPWHPAALRGSAGLHFAMPVGRAEGLPDSLEGRSLVAIDPEGERLDAVRIPERPLLAFGSERRGLAASSLERAELRVRIPMRAGVSSLNLATSVAVVLYAGRLSPSRGRGSGAR